MKILENKRVYIVMLIILVSPLLIYLYRFSGGISTNHSRWGEFGSYLSGVFGSFALFAVIYSTILTRRQFTKQNEDNLFLKLFDAHASRVAVFNFNAGTKSYIGQSAIEVAFNTYGICLKRCASNKFMEVYPQMKQFITKEQLKHCFKLAFYEKELLSEEDNANIIDYLINPENFRPVDDIFQDDTNDWNRKVVDTRSYLIESNFFRIDVSARLIIFKAAFDRMIRIPENKLMLYFSGFEFAIQWIHRAQDRESYLHYFLSQMSRNELSVIYYMFCGNPAFSKNNNEHVLNVYKNYDLTPLKEVEALFSNPSRNELLENINSILNCR